MKYRRIRVNLPKALIKEVEKVTDNKNAFIARAISVGLAKKEERRRELLEAYRYVAKHPEYEKDAMPDW
jgi:hypothetical protein